MYQINYSMGVRPHQFNIEILNIPILPDILHLLFLNPNVELIADWNIAYFLKVVWGSKNS